MLAALALLMAASYCGCSGAQSPEASLQNALANAGQTKDAVFPLAGQVTIDGQPPRFEKSNKKLIVMLNDSQKPDVPVLQRPYAIAEPDGKFAFMSYTKGDGVKAGNYILTFAVLRKKGKLGHIGPDDLHNLCNDPDVNGKIADFVIDHKSPGKSDYEFNLQVEGKEPVKTPGPHALTTLEIPTKRK